jgi:hypothetical protein
MQRQHTAILDDDAAEYSFAAMPRACQMTIRKPPASFA